MKWGVLVSSVALSASLACAGPAQAQGGSAQQRYEAAQAAFDAGNWADAAAGFEALLPDDEDAKLRQSRAVIALRFARAKTNLLDYEVARLWLDRGLLALAPDDPARIEGLLLSGNLARYDNDPVKAIAAYEEAVPLARAAGQKANVDHGRISIAMAAITYDPGKSITILDEEMAALAARMTGTEGEKSFMAQLQDLRARAALNNGDLADAESWISKAVEHFGDRSRRVDVLQSAIRGDAGIIYRLLKQDRVARRYFNYSGAGRQEDPNWISEYGGSLPVCGGADDIRPEDTAVVAIIVGEDGQVAEATPIFASRPGLIGSAFAREVMNWVWEPEAMAKVSPFWRATLRLQLRCEERPRPDSLSGPVNKAIRQWVFEQGWVEAGPGPSEQTVKLEQKEAAPPIAKYLAGHLARSETPKLPSRYKARAALLDELDAPAAAHAMLAYRSVTNGRVAESKMRRRYYARRLGEASKRMRLRFPQDTATAWLTLEYGLALEAVSRMEDARGEFEQILAIPQNILPANDPLRQVALLHAATLEAQAGARERAQSRLAAAGMTPEQCQLFDVRQVRTDGKLSGSDFPRAAREWGFEGYTALRFDVDEAGEPVNVRTVVAYPPFIFGESAERGWKRMRFSPLTIGGEPAGCSSQRQGISFRWGG